MDDDAVELKNAYWIKTNIRKEYPAPIVDAFIQFCYPTKLFFYLHWDDPILRLGTV